MSTRPNPRRSRRRRTNQESILSTLVKGGVVLGIIALALAFAVTVQEGVPGKDYSTLYVAAKESGSLRGNDKVAIGGVRVGRVVDVTPGTDGARIKLQLEPGVKLARDTKIRIRANGLLGARYVQLIPGSSPRRLGDGATIRGGRNVLSSTVPDALDVFNAETRGQLGATVEGLGRGVLGNGDGLNDAIRVSSDATVPFTRILDSVVDRGEPEQLLPSLNSMMSALDDSRDDVRRLLDPAARALQPFADQRGALRETVDEAPSALAATNTGLTAGSRLLAVVGDFAASAHRTLPAAPNGLRAATALLRRATDDGGNGTPLERATALLKAVPPAVPAALDVTRSLKPVLPRLNDGFAQLSPILQHVGRYGCDFINTGITLRSMTGMVGTGSGPNGPSSQFRLQAAAGMETLGIKEPVQKRDAYYQPCTYPGGHYDVTPLTGTGGR